MTIKQLIKKLDEHKNEILLRQRIHITALWIALVACFGFLWAVQFLG